ncbi:MAG: helix-turn-helix domain-containing protein [Hyphomicrobium sp.]
MIVGRAGPGSVAWLGLKNAAANGEGKLPLRKGSRVPPPKVRAAFAKRLREQRIRSGYKNARNFAHAIGIEENRYTRYERAEVEPDLTLIKRICDVLDVTPDHLLGFNDAVGVELRRALLRERLHDEGARLLLLLKQTYDHLDECMDIVSKLASRD